MMPNHTWPRLSSFRFPRMQRVGVALVLGLAVFTDNRAVAADEPAPPSQKVFPRPIHTVVPVHPPGLLAKLVSGDAKVEMVVGEDGKVESAKVESASHPEFGEAALAALRQWEFSPGAIGGKPTAMRVLVPVTFPIGLEQQLSVLAGRPVFREINEPIIPAIQMPSWPVPRKLMNPAYPKELEGSGKYGKAVVSIVVDKEGYVINPKIVKATYPEFELPAIITALQLRFGPQVMADKLRIYVSLDLQFDFKPPDKSSAAQPADKAPPAPAKKEK